MNARRPQYRAGGAGFGPQAEPRQDTGRRMVTRPGAPKMPDCGSKAALGSSAKTNTRECHLKMSRPDFHQVTEPDMDNVRLFLMDGDIFHSLWHCEPCGREWMRFTKVSKWGKREYRWGLVWDKKGSE